MPCYEELNSCFLFISVVSLDVCLATIALYLTTPFFGRYVRVLPKTKKHRQRVMVCEDRRPPKWRIRIPPLWISIECYYHIDARRVLANASAVASSSRGLLNGIDFMRQVEIAQSISTPLALGNFSTVHFCNRKVEALLVSRAKLGAIHHEEFKSIPL